MQCDTFGIVAETLTAWEQGSLGIILSVLSVLVGAGFAIKTQNLNFVLFSIALAVSLFFFPDAVSAVTGIDLSACRFEWTQQKMLTQDLKQCSGQIASYVTAGASCSCATFSTTPSCTPLKGTNPFPVMGAGTSGAPIIYQGGTFSGGPESKTYTTNGTLLTYTLEASGQCVIEYMNHQTEGEFCE